MATDATAAVSLPPWASMVFIWTGRGPSCKAPQAGRHRGPLARPGVSVTSRAGPGLDLYRGDEPPGAFVSVSQSPVSQIESSWAGPDTWSRVACPLHLQSSSVLAVGGQLGCRGISVTTLQKVTGVFSSKRHCDETSQGSGNAVEAIFFAVCQSKILLCTNGLNRSPLWNQDCRSAEIAPSRRPS